MESTTVKLDGHMLKELKAVKPPNQTLTALIREMLQAELRRRRMADASEKYLAFVRENPDENLEMDAWTSAPLDKEPSAETKRR